MKSISFSLIISILIVACGKGNDGKVVVNNGKPRLRKAPTTRTENPAPPAGTARATVVKNLELGSQITDKADSLGLESGLCAQLVIPNTGDNKGSKVIEISQGPCPAGNALVDDSNQDVSVLQIQSYGNSNEMKVYEKGSPTQLGVAYWASIADKNSNTPYKLDSLCTGSYESACYILADEERFRGVYVPY